MRVLLLPALVAALVATGCKAPTKHTGKRPEATRRESDMGPDKTIEERLAEREARLGAVAGREGSAVDRESQFVGVGTTHTFHDPDCAALREVPRTDRVMFVSSFDAMDGGYDPCELCTRVR